MPRNFHDGPFAESPDTHQPISSGPTASLPSVFTFDQSLRSNYCFCKPPWIPFSKYSSPCLQNFGCGFYLTRFWNSDRLMVRFDLFIRPEGLWTHSRSLSPRKYERMRWNLGLYKVTPCPLSIASSLHRNHRLLLRQYCVPLLLLKFASLTTPLPFPCHYVRSIAIAPAEVQSAER